MRKSILPMCVFCVIALLLIGCSSGNNTPIPPSPTDGPTSQTLAVLPGELVSFSFSESHSYHSRVQGYEFKVEDGLYTAGIWLADDYEEPYPVSVDDAWVEKLTDILEQYNTLSWDGFHGTDSMLLDGTSFGIMYTLSDGTSVTAGGYGDFPDGYGGASKAIDAHFLQLLPEDMRDW